MSAVAIEAEMLTVAEVAALMRCDEQTIMAAIRRGDLHAARIGPRTYRIPRSEVTRLIQPAPREQLQTH